MAAHLTASRISFASQPLPSAFSQPNRRRIPSSIIRMSSSTNSSETIEHVVLFKLKPQTPPAKLSTMLTNLNNLKSLNQVLHLTAGPIHNTTSNYTLILHSRYASKSDLATYASHPDHIHAVRESVFPICDDLLAIDWISHSPSLQPLIPPPNSAMRVTLLKLKSGVSESEKAAVVEAAKKVFGKVQQISVGENFSPDRAKGFSIASLAVYPTLADLQEAGKEVELGQFVDDVIALDYVVPSL